MLIVSTKIVRVSRQGILGHCKWACGFIFAFVPLALFALGILAKFH